ncbi:MAG: GLPGLI family protein [Chitinophagaceae bacterium]|nr:GLPGLI family protein [Chitinophagaceae bacterium]
MKTILISAALFLFNSIQAQVFINKGMIEYEVVLNNHKAMGEGTWAEMFKDKISRLSTSYYQLTFDTDKSIYRFNRKDEKTKSPWGNDGSEDNIWFNDYSNDKFVQQKNVFGEIYILTDSLKRIHWKITNENRMIAGFNCRKAVGILFDSVYVFAFYTDEITVTGGPMSLNGLPGMIMGITIPRMFSSWVATKLEVNGINYGNITAPVKGKKKKAAELQETVVKVTKDWGNWGQQAVWNIFL